MKSVAGSLKASAVLAAVPRTVARHVKAVGRTGLAFVMMAAVVVLPSAEAGAAQNELVVGIAFDGQSFTGDDPLDPGVGIAANHTAGDDERADNGVVRTYDLVGYRVDYNVNEEDQTGTTILLTLPANMTWVTTGASVSTAFPQGMFAGCLAGSTISSSGTVAPYDVVGTNDILSCVVGTADTQGSNGTIYPIAQLLADVDGQTKTLTGTLDTAEQPCGADLVCSGSVDVTSSATPQGNFKKGVDVEDASGTVLGREPNEFYPVQRGGVDGWISLYTLTFGAFGDSVLGSAPIDDSFAISFHDHFWDFPATTVFATDDGTLSGVSLLEDGRTVCGKYDGTGQYPAAAPGVWTCDQAVVGSSSVEVGITGYETGSFSANADESPNSAVYAAGQIALWTPEADLDAKVPSILTNSISNSATPPTGVGQADPIQYGATTGPVDEVTIVDNDASFSFNLVISPPGTRDLESWVRFMDGPFQARQYVWPFTGSTYVSVDERPSQYGGIGGIDTINTCGNNGLTNTAPGIEGWCGRQEVPRGKVVTLNAVAVGSLEGSTSIFDELHQCVAIDNTHMSLIALPSAFDVNIVEGQRLSTGEPNPGFNFRIHGTSTGGPVTVGGFTLSPNKGPLANVFASTESLLTHDFRTGAGGTNDIPASAYVVEFATSANPVRQIDDPTTVTTAVSVSQHGVTCNNDDAAGPGWIDATDTAAVDAAFDSDGDGLYEGIDRVRVRMVDAYDWLKTPEQRASVSLELNLQAQVHQDSVVDAAGQEIFAFTSRATGSWDPATQNQPAATNCISGESSWGGNTTTTTGWCNLPYTDDGLLGAPVGGLFFDTSAVEETLLGAAVAAHADKLTIVEANISIKKTNLDGLADIADNDEEVVFGFGVATIGATTDELNGVTLIDNLPAGYRFVSFNDDADGQCTATASSVSCDFGDHFGGWTDYVEIVVAVQNTDADKKITNIASLTATRADGAALINQSQAFSRTPPGYEESAILKAVNTIEGDCLSYPLSGDDVLLAPRPADWATRCEMTDFDTGQLLFDLSLTNEGNVTATGVVFVDVLPHVADEIEAASATGVIGDGRSPESNFEGDVSFVSYTGVDVDTVWVTGDPAAGVSRDPENALTDTTWCDVAGGAGIVQNPGNTGTGSCPATNAAVTAIYATMADVGVGQTVTGTLELANIGHECDDIWTNSFGARVERTLLPIRSNDVSIMVNCEFDLALRKTVDPAFTPGADWVTPGTTTVDFLVEVFNQGDPVEDFDVTDYVDTTVFTFDVANNGPGTTTGDQLLDFTWDATDPAAPVASVVGALFNGESVVIPVTLTIESLDAALDNYAEISRFDDNGDPSDGDSDPANPNNPTTAPDGLVDEDSTPDATPGDVLIDDEIAEIDPSVDEDDHDIASVPIFDLELVKTITTSATNPDMVNGKVAFDITVTNQGVDDVFFVDVIEYPPAGLSIDAATTLANLPAGVTATGADTFQIAGPIAAGVSVSFPVTFDIVDITQAPFVNAAEIFGFEDDNDPQTPVGPFVVDVDSTPDTTNDPDYIDQDAPNYDPDDDQNLNEPTPGDEDDHDVAVFVPPVRVGNFVWYDANNDGIQDDGELPVEGVTVNLLDENGDPVLDDNEQPITATTDVDGEYYFDVEPGLYIVEFDPTTLPTGYAFTDPVEGSDTAEDSDADPVTGRSGVIDVSDVTLLGDTDDDGILDDYSWDAGIVQLARIGNFVWVDANNDGIQDDTEDPVPGVVVNLLDGDGDPVLDGNGDPITTTTDVNGEYFFDVPAGDYIIEFDPTTLPDNTQFTSPGEGDAATGSDADRATGQTTAFNVDPSVLTDTDEDGIVDDYTHDAGIVDLARIGNFVWLDSDNNGVQDPGEAPVPDVVVNLLDGNGDPVLDANGDPVTTVTDAGGRYFFDVVPGDYVIEFVTSTLPAGFVFTTANSGGDATDSDADPATGRTAVFSVDPAVLTDTDGDGVLDDYSYDAGINMVAEVPDTVTDPLPDPVAAPLPDTGNSPLQLLWLALASILAGMFLIVRSRDRKGALIV